MVTENTQKKNKVDYIILETGQNAIVELNSIQYKFDIECKWFTEITIVQYYNLILEHNAADYMFKYTQAFAYTIV